MPTPDEHFMQRCLDLASLAAGACSPNPMVGCVIVCEGQIISEGWHKKAGENHAEREAILRIAGDERLQRSTLYVNLEPCAHHGKTPPCADLIAAHGIPEVVFGCRDPFHEVDGKGIENLKSNGVFVRGPVLEESCIQLNRRFFTFHTQKRPYVILKWAETADGFMAPENRERIQISGKEAQTLLHRWRSEEDAILIGSGTMVQDKPQLNNRLWTGKSPLPIVFDALLKGDYSGFEKAWVLNRKRSEKSDGITYIQIADDNFIPAAIKACYDQNITSILVEGGASTIQHWIARNLWDEMRVIQSKKVKFTHGVLAPKVVGKLVETLELTEDRVSIYRNI